VREAVVPEGSALQIGTGERAYLVLVGAGLSLELPGLLVSHTDARRFAIISDDTVAPLHGERLAEECREAGLDATLLTFPAGEASKTRKSWSILTDEMLDAGFGRDSCVVALGGGVTTDLGGFVASTFLRGIPVVQVPTSYLAMIDASVGGKTGVDVRHGKNLVGAFHPPELVVIDPTLLATLPLQDRAEGLVEAFKHGAILDAEYFASLEGSVAELLAAEPGVASRVVGRSVELKGRVVTEDERESGLRQILNFGHTVGHAVEAASEYALGHGSSIAIGMVAEARVGERLGVTSGGTADRLQAALGELLGTLPGGLDPERVLPFLAADKKRRAGRPRCVLLSEVGTVDRGDGWTHEVPEEVVSEVLARL